MNPKRNRLSIAALLALAIPALQAPAAESVSAGMLDQPCPAPLPMPDSAHRLLVDMFMRPHVLGQTDFGALMADRDFAAYNSELRRRGATDWAGLCHFQAANAAQKPGAARVVYIGDSITENWLLADPGYFTGAVVNRGIGAQTWRRCWCAPRADVVALKPAVVHILAGTNDVSWRTTVRCGRQDFQNNIESMVEIARANGIRVILGSIPPWPRQLAAGVETRMAHRGPQRVDAGICQPQRAGVRRLPRRAEGRSRRAQAHAGQ